jgi:hypothetical protein
LLCWLGWHCGQLHFEAGQGLAPAFDELTKHGKLCRCAIAVRSRTSAFRPIPASKAARTKHRRCKAAASNKP